MAALRALEGNRLAIRIALRHRTEDLVAVFHGRLGPLAHDAKKPSLFWALESQVEAHPEQPGIYLRERDFERAELRAGGILVIKQADVVLNVRPLKEP